MKPLLAVYFIVVVAAPFEFMPPLARSLRRGRIDWSAARACLWWWLAFLIWALLWIES
jgi:hypothetical protein